MATYQWRAITQFASDTTLSYGVSPDDSTSWQTAAIGAGTSTHTYIYYYRDASAPCGATDCNTAGSTYCDATSNRVAFNVTETWTTSLDATTNRLTAVVHTVINSIVRDDLRGQQCSLFGRTINIYRGRETTPARTITETGAQVASQHTIATNVDLGTQTLVLDPALENGVSTLHIHNQVAGGTSYDDIYAGTQFKNTLPEPTAYTLSYNANGGSGAPGNQTGSTGAGSYTFTIPSTRPTHSWWDFIGWATSASAASAAYQPGSSITLQQSSPSQTLYAVWDKTYRPGGTYNNDAWHSHDRSAGAANIYTGSAWREMRTKDGNGSTAGDPPYIRSSSAWVNQRRIGNT